MDKTGQWFTAVCTSIDIGYRQPTKRIVKQTRAAKGLTSTCGGLLLCPGTTNLLNQRSRFHACKLGGICAIACRYIRGAPVRDRHADRQTHRHTEKHCVSFSVCLRLPWDSVLELLRKSWRSAIPELILNMFDLVGIL